MINMIHSGLSGPAGKKTRKKRSDPWAASAALFSFSLRTRISPVMPPYFPHLRRISQLDNLFQSSYRLSHATMLSYFRLTSPVGHLEQFVLPAEPCRPVHFRKWFPLKISGSLVRLPEISCASLVIF